MPEDKILLTDPEVYPTDEVLLAALGKDVFAVYQQLSSIITGEEFKLTPEWNYYKDGKAWLCKVTHKKKTVFWLSVWPHLISIGFYFTEKTGANIASLAISKKVKAAFEKTKPVGKLLPLSLQINKEVQLSDLKKIIRYKQGLQ